MNHDSSAGFGQAGDDGSSEMDRYLIQGSVDDRLGSSTSGNESLLLDTSYAAGTIPNIVTTPEVPDTRYTRFEPYGFGGFEGGMSDMYYNTQPHSAPPEWSFGQHQQTVSTQQTNTLFASHSAPGSPHSPYSSSSPSVSPEDTLTNNGQFLLPTSAPASRARSHSESSLCGAVSSPVIGQQTFHGGRNDYLSPVPQPRAALGDGRRASDATGSRPTLSPATPDWPFPPDSPALSDRPLSRASSLGGSAHSSRRSSPYARPRSDAGGLMRIELDPFEGGMPSNGVYHTSGSMSGDAVVRQQVTTEAVQRASSMRRRAEAAFRCGTCGQTFTRKANLDGHTLSHKGQKPYTCSQAGCDKAFTRKNDLKRHLKTHKSASDDISHRQHQRFS